VGEKWRCVIFDIVLRAFFVFAFVFFFWFCLEDGRGWPGDDAHQGLELLLEVLVLGRLEKTTQLSERGHGNLRKGDAGGMLCKVPSNTRAPGEDELRPRKQIRRKERDIRAPSVFYLCRLQKIARRGSCSAA
jgi:hypothetical protein